MRKLACIITLLLFSVAVVVAQDQGKLVKGKVADASTGKGIPGASVIVRGNTTGTQTDADGNFSIVVPSPATAKLEIGSVGYERQVVDVKSKTTLLIKLALESKALEDVVVIGYGTQSRRNVSGAQTSFDVKTIQEHPIASVDQAMIGQMPGVVIKQQTGLTGQEFILVVRVAGL